MWEEVIIYLSCIWIGSGTTSICLSTHGTSVVRKFLVVLESSQEKFSSLLLELNQAC